MAELWTKGGAISIIDGAIALATWCCCGQCCEFLNCDPSADPLYEYYLCDGLPVDIEVGDIIEIGDECFAYQGIVDCEGDETTADFGDVFETCDDCLCICAIYTECENSENEIRLKRCRPFSVTIGPGDVIEHDGTCYEYDHGTECQGGEDEVVEVVYESCIECCPCVRLTICDDDGPEDPITLRICSKEIRDALAAGGVIRYNSLCWEIDGVVECVGGETILDQKPDQVYTDCDDCIKCPCCKDDDSISKCTITLSGTNNKEEVDCPEQCSLIDGSYEVSVQRISARSCNFTPVGDLCFIRSTDACDDEGNQVLGVQITQANLTVSACIPGFDVTITSTVGLQIWLGSDTENCSGVIIGGCAYRKIVTVPADEVTIPMNCISLMNGQHDNIEDCSSAGVASCILPDSVNVVWS